MGSEHSSVVRLAQQYTRSRWWRHWTGPRWSGWPWKRVRLASGGDDMTPPPQRDQISDTPATTKAGCLHKWPLMPTPGPFCRWDSTVRYVQVSNVHPPPYLTSYVVNPIFLLCKVFPVAWWELVGVDKQVLTLIYDWSVVMFVGFQFNFRERVLVPID